MSKVRKTVAWTLAFATALSGATIAGASEAKAADKTDIYAVTAQYGPNTTQWWADFQTKFNEANPDINLTVECVSWNDIYTKVSTLIQNDQAPDILNIDTFADYQADDLLLPVSDYISDETYAKFYQSFLDQSVVDDTVWAVPDLASVRGLFYNKDLLEGAGVEVPTTWDELTEACKKLKDKYGDDVYPWGIDMTTDEGQAAFSYYTWNNGGGFVDDDGNWALNSDANVEAIQYAIGLVNDGYTNTDPATQTRYDLQDLFGQGKLAMMIGPNGIPTYLKDGGYEINYGVSTIPTNTDTSTAQGVMDRFMVFDNDDDDTKLAAISKFFDTFYDDEPYSQWVLMEDFLPATSTGADAMVKADDSYSGWLDILANAKFYPTAKAEWIDVKQGVIDVEQQALQGGDVKELLDDLQSEIAG